MSEEEFKKYLPKIQFKNEYPIIWYEPDIDSEEKKSFKARIQESNKIKLCSKFEEAFHFAQMFGSFLLIVSNNANEEKLFEEFGALEDTYGRRYFDFEEKAVLTSLFSEISAERVKALKVYAFCTHEDFWKRAPLNKEEEEEVMVMCQANELADQFQEEFTIIWCDINFSSENKEILINEFNIQEKNIYTNVEDLLKRLDKKNEPPYHLILSEKTRVQKVIEKTKNSKDLLGLYIYDDAHHVISAEEACKIKVEQTLRDLIPRIKKGIRTNSRFKTAFPAFATSFDAWDKSHINKIHYYLRGFVKFSNRRQAKRDFVNLAKRIYESQKLIEFEKEYFEYSKEKILKWYAEESPIYKLINNCLRISSSDSIPYCRFILKDMERAIREEYHQQSPKYNGVVYRAAYISNDEFERLERNIGKEIEMYGFLSTSKNLRTARKFLTGGVDKALITIIIPPLPLTELDEQGFVELSQFSKFPKEEEVLFNVRSRFQVLEVGKIKLDGKEEERKYLVLLYGAQLLRKSMTIENPTIHLKLELSLEFKCNNCGSKNNLFASTMEARKTEMICKECVLTTNLTSENTFLLPIDDESGFNETKVRNLEVKGKMLEFGVQTKFTYEKTKKCHQCFHVGEDVHFTWINMKDENIIIECPECFRKAQERQPEHLLLLERNTHVFWRNKQEKWEEIDAGWKAEEFKYFDFFSRAYVFLKGQDAKKCQEFCRKNLENLARKMGKEKEKVVTYGYLGSSSRQLGYYQKAVEYQLKVLDIQKILHGKRHPLIGGAYENLALAYVDLGEYPKALKCYLKALEIDNSIDGKPDLDSADLYNNLAFLYGRVGDHSKALKYNLKALDLHKSIYGETHPRTADSYSLYAWRHHNLGDNFRALEFGKKALDIYKSIYGEAHEKTAISYDRLAGIYNNLGDYQTALKENLKAIDVYKSINEETDSNLANSYLTLSVVYENLRDNKKALEYNQKALDIYKSIYGEEHQETADAYQIFAEISRKLGDHQTALVNNFKALNIYLLKYGETHHQTGRSYRSLALLFIDLGDYQKALEYNQKAVDIFRSTYGEIHSDTADAYEERSDVYLSLGDSSKALEFSRKAFFIQKFKYGETDARTADSYHNLAFVYKNLGDYQKALENNFKALEIRKYIFKEMHPKTINSYHSLASVYTNLEDYKKALEYNQKALDLCKFIESEAHEKTADSYNSFASTYVSLGDYQKALENYLKALDIRKSICGETNLKSADLYYNLAYTYNNLGDYQKALENYLKALDIRKSTYGETNLKNADLYDNLAYAYSNLGDYQNALENNLKALEIRKSTSLQAHPKNALSYQNLASTYQDLKDYPKALESILKALDIRKSVYGETHQETTTTYKDVAIAYEDLGDHQKALEYKLKAKIQEPIHEDVHVTVHNHLGQADLSQESIIVSESNADENEKSPVLQGSFEVEKSPYFDDLEDSNKRNTSMKISCLANSPINIQPSQVLGKRGAFENNDEENFEPNLQKKIKNEEAQLTSFLKKFNM